MPVLPKLTTLNIICLTIIFLSNSIAHPDPIIQSKPISKTNKKNKKNSSQTCAKESDHCLYCDSLGNCVKCQDNYFLDTDIHPYGCIPCPRGCLTCSDNFCTICAQGYFLNKLSDDLSDKGICEKCSPNCKICDGDEDICTDCYDMFKLDDETQSCVFKFFNLLIGIVVICLVTLIIILAILAWYCFSNSGENDKFDTILDKDEDLVNDAYKTEIKSIGITRKSNLSEVLPGGINDSFQSESDLHEELFCRDDREQMIAKERKIDERNWKIQDCSDEKNITR